MKVLISAYACEPGAGSEPGAGWTWSRAAALAGNEVWLLTRENNRGLVEAALEGEPDLALHPVFLDLEWGLRFKRGQRGIRAYYLLWQLEARRVIERLHSRIGFDVAHHLTFAIDWMPAAAVGVPGLPSVWGPVGGAGSIPLRLWRWLGPVGVAQELLREALVRPARRLAGDRNARRAGVTVALNDAVARRFKGMSHRLVVEPNVALPSGLGGSGQSDSGAGQARTAVFVGRLVAWKGARLAVAAMAHLPDDWVLEIYGGGPEHHRIRAEAAARSVQDRVVLRGKRPRPEVLSAMARADVLVLPSMHDSAGWVVGEAAHLGTPVVALDLGGPATMLRAMEGAPVAVTSNVVEDLAAHMVRAAALESEPSGRWSEDRLPTTLSDWYGMARQAKSDTRADS